MNIKNTKKVKIRTRLQTITETFPNYHYDMESTNDEWLVYFSKENIKFVLEISSIDDDINNFKVFSDNKWLIYSENSFEKIINLAENKITELYG